MKSSLIHKLRTGQISTLKQAEWDGGKLPHSQSFIVDFKTTRDEEKVLKAPTEKGKLL